MRVCICDAYACGALPVELRGVLVHAMHMWCISGGAYACGALPVELRGVLVHARREQMDNSRLGKLTPQRRAAFTRSFWIEHCVCHQVATLKRKIRSRLPKLVAALGICTDGKQVLDDTLAHREGSNQAPAVRSRHRR